MMQGFEHWHLCNECHMPYHSSSRGVLGGWVQGNRVEVDPILSFLPSSAAVSQVGLWGRSRVVVVDHCLYRAARESSPPTVSHRPGLVWEGLAQGTIVYTDPPGLSGTPAEWQKLEQQWREREDSGETLLDKKKVWYIIFVWGFCALLRLQECTLCDSVVRGRLEVNTE